jgi:hypothetical protein
MAARADLLALAGLLVVMVVFNWDLLTGPTLLGMDTSTAFYPWYSFLGEQLRAGHIPTWNPHEFAGAPFAADPESGWMYLPAMLVFALLPLESAARAFLLVQVAIAGFSTYALARAFRINVLGSAVAAIAYAQSGFLLGYSVCCFSYSGVACWLPLMLLGAERAVRATRWSQRGLWWGLGGLALSQILAVWVGQGSYYAVLVLGGFLAYRTLFLPISGRQRLGLFAINGAGIAAFSIGLAAAGLLPRLEYNVLSNLPGGYPDDPSTPSVLATRWLNWGILDSWERRLLQPGFYYVGLTTLVLAVTGVVLGRRSSYIPFLTGLCVVVLILSSSTPTPLHALAALLPGFERIHDRSPERLMLVFYLGPALLAGIGVQALSQLRPALLGTSLAALAFVALGVDMRLSWSVQATESLHGGGEYQFAYADLGRYYAPTGAAQFMQAQPADEPFRYFGHAEHIFGGTVPYTLRWTDPSIIALETTNRATVSGLEDIQGYDPVHVARYDRLMAALNGEEQNYHHADVLPGRLDSPLLDLLNVRYIVLPRVIPQDQLPPGFDRQLNVVYADDQVQVLDNPTALPRAWLVHSARQVAPGEAATLLGSGEVDPRQVALLEQPPPALGADPGPGLDRVSFLQSDTDQVWLRTTSPTDALLVASEVYYPAWRAYVDGQPEPVLVADEALRAVSVPAGEHVVEFRYQSGALTIGVLITSSSAILLAALVALASGRVRR